MMKSRSSNDDRQGASHEALLALRDAWIAAENARTEAYRAFMDANRNSPLRRELNAAEEREKRAKDAYAKALQKQQKESPHGADTRPEAL